MNCRYYRGPGRDLACLAGQSVLEVRISAALADSRSVAADCNRSAEDQVHRLHFTQRHLAAELERAFDTRRFVYVLSQPGRIQLDEALLFTEAWHRHIDYLARLERQLADSSLGRVGVRLDHPCLLPRLELADQLGAFLRTGKVRDAPARSRKSSDSSGLHFRPDRISDLILGHRIPPTDPGESLSFNLHLPELSSFRNTPDGSRGIVKVRPTPARPTDLEYPRRQSGDTLRPSLLRQRSTDPKTPDGSRGIVKVQPTLRHPRSCWPPIHSAAALFHAFSVMTFQPSTLNLPVAGPHTSVSTPPFAFGRGQ